ncbi:MAG: ABC transporter permease [Flavobacteriaceae bacterium]
MVRFLSHKLLQMGLTLLGVVTIVFFLFSVLPGDPSQMMLGQNQNQEQQRIIQKKYGFDLAVEKQYLFFLNDLSPFSIHSQNPASFSHYDKNKYGGLVLVETKTWQLVVKWPYLRTSYQKRGKPVAEIIAETLPNTFVLAVAAMSIAVFLGILLGIVAMLQKGRFLDTFLQGVSTLGMSLPSFFSAIIASWLFGLVWHEFTGLNMTGSLYELDDYGETNHLELKNLVLPALVLGIRPLAVITQLMRNSLLEVMEQDYIRTARAKGLSRYQIIYKHALKNALNPVVTAISGWFASLLAGAIFVEYIFGWKGLGKEIVMALNTLDIPVIMGAVLIIAFFFIIINIVVDMLYVYLDPQVKL